jgi:flagellin
MSVNFSVNTNSAASNILQNLYYVQNQVNTSYSQLSSGNRINTAADDPAGYAISQQMQQNVNGLNTAVQNSQNGISMIQTASGAMQQVGSILQTLNTLAVEAANSTQNSADLTNLQTEWTSLTNQISTINANTQFNTISLFSGDAVSTVGLTLQVGAQQGQILNFSTTSLSLNVFGIGSSVGISTINAAATAITQIANAISLLNSYEANLGSIQDQLNYTVSNLQNASTNLQNAQGTITNTNMAQAYTTFTQDQVLTQVGTAMLSQAQQQPAAILKLLS